MKLLLFMGFFVSFSSYSMESFSLGSPVVDFEEYSVINESNFDLDRFLREGQNELNNQQEQVVDLGSSSSSSSLETVSASSSKEEKVVDLSSPSSSSSLETIEGEVTDEIYRCLIMRCAYKTYDIESLRVHIGIEHSYYLESMQEKKPRNGIKRPIRKFCNGSGPMNGPGYELKCRLCSEVKKNVSELMSHLLDIHTQKIGPRCPLSDGKSTQFTTRAGARKHLSIYHSAMVGCLFSQCNTWFSGQKDFAQHLTKKHSAEVGFDESGFASCLLRYNGRSCGKSFMSKAAFEKHLEDHYLVLKAKFS